MANVLSDQDFEGISRLLNLPSPLSDFEPIRHIDLLGALIPLIANAVTDNEGNFFSPSSASHTYGYDNSTPPKIATDAATINGVTRIKSFTWSGGQLIHESQWEVQP